MQAINPKSPASRLLQQSIARQTTDRTDKQAPTTIHRLPFDRLGRRRATPLSNRLQAGSYNNPSLGRLPIERTSRLLPLRGASLPDKAVYDGMPAQAGAYGARRTGPDRHCPLQLKWTSRSSHGGRVSPYVNCRTIHADSAGPRTTPKSNTPWPAYF